MQLRDSGLRAQGVSLALGRCLEVYLIALIPIHRTGRAEASAVPEAAARARCRLVRGKLSIRAMALHHSFNRAQLETAEQ